MNISKSFMKNKTSYNAQYIKRVVDARPDLILQVFENEKTVAVRHEDNYALYEIEHKEWLDVLEYIKNEIRTRPDPKKRVELWECKNLDGLHSIEIEQRLLKNREKIKPRQQKRVSVRALNELCNIYNLPSFMGKLFLSELKLSRNPNDVKAIKRAQILGLM